jgi:peptide deformylase
MSNNVIIQAGNPILFKKAFPIQVNQIKNKTTVELVAKIKEILKQEEVTSLSAPQIGISIRAIAIKLKSQKNKETTQKPITTLINPIILEKSEEKVMDWENCHSICSGKLWGIVPRYKWIRIIGHDETGIKITLKLTDNEARQAQHQMDHLEGIYFLQRMQKKDMTYLSMNEHLEAVKKSYHPESTS